MTDLNDQERKAMEIAWVEVRHDKHRSRATRRACFEAGYRAAHEQERLIEKVASLIHPYIIAQGSRWPAAMACAREIVGTILADHEEPTSAGTQPESAVSRDDITVELPVAESLETMVAQAIAKQAGPMYGYSWFRLSPQVRGAYRDQARAVLRALNRLDEENKEEAKSCLT